MNKVCATAASRLTHGVAAVAAAAGLALVATAHVGAQAASQGSWRTLAYPMSINPIHLALLNTGKVLVIAGSGNDPSVTDFQAEIWDPQTGTQSVMPLTWDMFCNGMIVLPDGRPFVNGGNLQYDPFYGLPRNAVFDPITSTFTDVQSMAHGRWYPTTTLLGDGRVMSFSGTDENGNTDSTVEIYTPGVGWSPEYPSGWVPPLYPRLHLLPNGTVFYSSSGTGSRFFNPSTNAWTQVVATTNYSGTRRYGSSVLLPLTPANGYRPKVIIFGGGNPSTNTTELIDLSSSTPVWQPGPPMSQPRIEMSATLLPNGKVLAVGGSLNDEEAASASLNADLYDPATNTMSAAGQNVFPRLYHSGALLLPDATVALVGGNPVRGSFEGHIEIYSPAYLFNGDGTPATRPTITSVSAGPYAYGASFQVQTPDAANISSVVLVRPGAPTHSFDMEQRLVALSYTAGAGVLDVTAPPNSNIAPPGYYMLFVLNAAGVPSVASFVQVQQSTPAQRPVATIVGPAADATVQAGGTVSFSGSGSDPNGGTITSYLWSFPGGTPSTSTSANPGAVRYSTPGTYVASLTVTNNLGLTSTNSALRIVTVPDFVLTAAPSSETALPGGTAIYGVNVTGTIGFTGTINLSVTGLPGDATATFSPSSIANGGTSVLSVATHTAPPGKYTLTVRATSGVVTHTATIAVVIGGCDDTLTVSYAGGTLNLGFRLGTTTPGTWSTYLISPSTSVQLWSAAVPIISPAQSFNIPIPSFPNLGLIYIVTTLTNSGGASCLDYRPVNTGS